MDTLYQCFIQRGKGSTETFDPSEITFVPISKLRKFAVFCASHYLFAFPVLGFSSSATIFALSKEKIWIKYCFISIKHPTRFLWDDKIFHAAMTECPFQETFPFGCRNVLLDQLKLRGMVSSVSLTPHVTISL